MLSASVGAGLSAGVPRGSTNWAPHLDERSLWLRIIPESGRPDHARYSSRDCRSGGRRHHRGRWADVPAETGGGRVSATLSIATRAAAATLTMVFLSSKRVPRDLARG